MAMAALNTAQYALDTRPRLPYEIFSLIVHFADASTYFSLVHVNITFRRLVYDDLTRRKCRIPPKLAIHLLNNQFPSRPAAELDIWAPAYTWRDFLKDNPRVNSFGIDPGFEVSSGNRDLDMLLYWMHWRRIWKRDKKIWERNVWERNEKRPWRRFCRFLGTCRKWGVKVSLKVGVSSSIDKPEEV